MQTRITSSAVTGRVYDNIKARVIAHEFTPGARLQLDALAMELGVSTTPVREALSRLVAEGLIESRPQKGFFVMAVSAEKFRELYELNYILLESLFGKDGIGHFERRHAEFPQLEAVLGKLRERDDMEPADLARFTGETFLQIAARSGNDHVTDIVRHINDQLYYLRTLECQFLNNTHQELVEICDMFLSRQYSDLAEFLKVYHGKRLTLIPDVLKALKY